MAFPTVPMGEIAQEEPEAFQKNITKGRHSRNNTEMQMDIKKAVEPNTLMNPKQDDFDDMTSQGSTMMVKGAAGNKFDDMSSQGSYMIKGPRGGQADDMSSNASYMVKGNNRIDDMSSQGSFMVKANGFG